MRIMGYIEYLFYAMLLWSIYLIFQDQIIYLIKSTIWDFQNTFSSSKANRVIEHLKMLFLLLDKKNVEKAVNLFLLLTIVLFSAFCTLLINQKFGFSSIFIAGFVAVLPYAYIRAKVETMRLSGSYEGEIVITEFINHYKACGRNIVSTIDLCVLSLTEKEPVAKKAFFRLSIKIKSAQNEEEVNAILKEFVLATKTNWAQTLADNIYNAFVEKTDILAGLEDLLKDCEDINSNLQKVKRNNIEAVVMIRFLGPAFLVMFAYLTKASVDLTWSEIRRTEFNTPVGLILFILIITSFGVSLISSTLLVKQKYDI